MISVIIPIYKVERYLKCCVGSVINQTYKDLEIILVDDGSPDGCPKICDEYAKTDSRIKVIHKENGGLSSARNAGLDAAEGEYITFVDSDDRLHPQTLEVLISLAKKSGGDIVGSHYDFFDSDDEISDKTYSSDEIVKLSYTYTKCSELLKNFSDNFRRVSLISMCMKLYKAEIFSDLRVPEGYTEEDSLVLPYILEKAGSIYKTEEKLYHWRNTPGSITRKGFNAADFSYIEVAYSDAAFFIERGSEKQAAFFKKLYLKRSLEYYYKIPEDRKDLYVAYKPYMRKYKSKFLKYSFSKGMCISEWLAYLLFSVSPKGAKKLYLRVYGES